MFDTVLNASLDFTVELPLIKSEINHFAVCKIQWKMCQNSAEFVAVNVILYLYSGNVAIKQRTLVNLPGIT